MQNNQQNGDKKLSAVKTISFSNLIKQSINENQKSNSTKTQQSPSQIQSSFGQMSPSKTFLRQKTKTQTSQSPDSKNQNQSPHQAQKKVFFKKIVENVQISLPNLIKKVDSKQNTQDNFQLKKTESQQKKEKDQEIKDKIKQQQRLINEVKGESVYRSKLLRNFIMENVKSSAINPRSLSPPVQKMQNPKKFEKDSDSVSENHKKEMGSTQFYIEKQDRILPNFFQTSKNFLDESKKNHLKIYNLMKICQDEIDKLPFYELTSIQSRYFIQLVYQMGEEKGVYQEAMIYLRNLLEKFVTCTDDKIYRQLSDITNQIVTNESYPYVQIVKMLINSYKGFTQRQKQEIKEYKDQFEDMNEQMHQQDTLIEELRNKLKNQKEEFEEQKKQHVTQLTNEKQQLSNKIVKMMQLLQEKADEMNRREKEYKSFTTHQRIEYSKSVQKLAESKAALVQENEEISKNYFRLQEEYDDLIEQRQTAKSALKFARERNKELNQKILALEEDYKELNLKTSCAWDELTPRPSLKKLEKKIEGKVGKGTIKEDYYQETTKNKVERIQIYIEEHYGLLESKIIELENLVKAYANGDEKNLTPEQALLANFSGALNIQNRTRGISGSNIKEGSTLLKELKKGKKKQKEGDGGNFLLAGGQMYSHKIQPSRDKKNSNMDDSQDDNSDLENDNKNSAKEQKSQKKINK